jgi:hypothetical protein
MYCFYYIKSDPNKEPLGKAITKFRLKAAQSFADRKQLPLKEFLKLFAVEKKNSFLL